MKKHLILFAIATSALISCINAEPQKLLAGDYRIFQSTKAWELAKAINDDDTDRIKQLVSANRKLTTIVDPKYGQTLLGLAVIDLKYNSVKTLLELGADPNAFNNYDGKTPLMNSIDIGGILMKNDPRYLTQLLKYGGNPNLESKATDYGPGSTSPLIIAANDGNLEYLKILISAGADLHKDDQIILYAAFNSENPDVVAYLLNNGANYKKSILFGGNYYTISDLLRSWAFDIGSEKYKKKMQIVEFLKTRGVDYRHSRIPKSYYKEYSKDYLEKY